MVWPDFKGFEYGMAKKNLVYEFFAKMNKMTLGMAELTMDDQKSQKISEMTMDDQMSTKKSEMTIDDHDRPLKDKK